MSRKSYGDVKDGVTPHQRSGNNAQAPTGSIFTNSSSGDRSAHSVADWSTADARDVLDCIAKVAARGGAIRFGYTRDGGAYAVGLYYGNDHTTKYLRPGESIEAFLEEITEPFNNLPNTAGKAPEVP